MIFPFPSTFAFAFGALAQNAAQPHSEPTVEVWERPFMTMFEVFKPAFQGSIDPADDLLQALPVGATGQLPQTVLEFLEALFARPSVASLEVIPQKVKAALLRLRPPRASSPGAASVRFLPSSVARSSEPHALRLRSGTAITKSSA